VTKRAAARLTAHYRNAEGARYALTRRIYFAFPADAVHRHVP
jgi:hypothetical protein